MNNVTVLHMAKKFHNFQMNQIQFCLYTGHYNYNYSTCLSWVHMSVCLQLISLRL